MAGMNTYPDRGNFITHGTYTVSNAIGYEVEISKHGGCARAMYTKHDGTVQISHWVEIRNVTDEDGNDEQVFEAFGSDIEMSQVMRAS